jgi:titin
LDVIVIGSRPVDVHWLKDGVKVEPSIVHKMLQDGNQHTLLILEAQAKDSGVYECVAINVNGKVTCSTTVKVGQGDSSLQHVKKQAAVKLASDQSQSKVTSVNPKEKAPEVMDHLSAVLVKEGSQASFRCRIANVKSKF